MTDTTNKDNDKEKEVKKQLKIVPKLENEHGLKLKEKIPFTGYDLEGIEKFFDVVFHGLEDTANILTWRVKPERQPFYPIPEQHLYTKLRNSPKEPHALYYGTASCKLDEKSNKLRNRKDLFHALHVVVLDDIGTKVPFERIPEDFPPTYKIQSSEGNFQYGYVLTEPVTNLPAAEALIQFVYGSGLSDKGGKMPNKLVRLPDGVNGKRGAKEGFECQLTEMNPDTMYSPQEILDALNLGVDWNDILEDAEEVLKRKTISAVGLSPWSPVKAVGTSLDGITDPVLEWLFEKAHVITDNGGEWIEVKCPWHGEHTTGGKTAGYSPIGRGTDLGRRGFHCFHDSCEKNVTIDFLTFVTVSGGPEAGTHDRSAYLTSRWGFDGGNGWAWDIPPTGQPRHIALSSFKEIYSRSVVVPTVDGKVKKIKEHALWTTSPARVIIAGCMFDPSTSARMVERGGYKYVNMFTQPEWPNFPINQPDVAKFLGYMHYLLPDVNDYEYVLDWIAAKVQNMGFRGAALLMVAQVQGIGRSTMTDMLKTLFGAHNTETVPFNQILGGGEFNEWVEKPLIFSDETLSGDKNDYYRGYEKLKGLIDPRPQRVTINPKYGQKREGLIHSSFIFLSNHADAVVLPETDRRFYTLYNAINPAPPSYFDDLNAWLQTLDSEGKPAWAAHVWNYLRLRDIDLPALLAPPPRTQAKMEMIADTRSATGVMVDTVVDLWPVDYACPSDLAECVFAASVHFGIDEVKNFHAIVKKLIKAKLINYPNELNIRVRRTDPHTGKNSQVRPQALNKALKVGRIGNPREAILLSPAALDRLKKEITVALVETPDKSEIIEQLTARLREEGL